jgi:pentatricopeptide repeat protein
MVIRHYVGVGEAEKAHAIFKRIEEFGLEPNDVSYTLVIQGFARNRQEKKAMSLLRDMEANGFYLDNATCADLITCLGKAGNTELAYMIFNQFSKRGGSHEPCDYKAIIEAYARAGDNGMALRLYDDMCSAGIVPSQDMYEVVTRVLRRAGRLSDLQMLMQERNMLDFFDGNNKALQETLLKILFLFMESIKSRTRCSSQALPGIGTRTSEP